MGWLLLAWEQAMWHKGRCGKFNGELACRLCNFTLAFSRQQLPSPNVYIYCVDHPLCALLAAGYFGVGIVSFFLDTHAPMQGTRYCSGWLFGFTKRHHPATRQNAATVAPGSRTNVCLSNPSLANFCVVVLLVYKMFQQYPASFGAKRIDHLSIPSQACLYSVFFYFPTESL